MDTKKVRKMSAHRVVPLLLSGWCLTGTTLAAEWTTEPRIAVSVTYNDNIRLAPPHSEISSVVTQLTPGITVRGRGRQMTADLDYTLQDLIYTENSANNSVRQQINSHINATLRENAFYFDGGLTFNQEVSANSSVIPQDTLNLAGNPADVLTVRLSPYWKRAFGTSATTEARYNHTRVGYTDGGAIGSNTHEVVLRAGTGTRFNEFSASLDYKASDIIYDHRQTAGKQLDNAGLNLGYKLNPHWTALLGGSYEHDDYVLNKTPINVELSGWDAGLRWVPQQRTRLEARGGERGSSKSYALDFSHAARSSSWSLKYAEALTTQAIDVAQRQLAVLDPTNNTFTKLENTSDLARLLATPGAQLGTVLGSASTQDVQLSKTWTAGMRWSLRKNKFTASLMDRRDSDDVATKYTARSATKHTYGWNSGWEWAFAPKTRYTLTFGRTHSQGDVTVGRDGTYWRASTGLTYQRSARLNMGLDYSYYEHRADASAFDFMENRVTARTTYRF